MNNTLNISNLVVTVNDKQVLGGINLVVSSGEVHVVMGPNGSGKSSLANTLVGNEEYLVQSGKVFFNDKDLLSLSISDRANSGIFLAFQNPVEVEGVTVQNFLKLAYQSRFKNEEEKLFAKAIQFREHLRSLTIKFEIDESLLTRGLNEGFSGGEKKQLEILQLVLLEPKFAIIDEIDSGLDVDAVKKVAKVVEYVVKEYGTGIVIITHSKRILQYLFFNFVHVLINGLIVKEGGRELVNMIEEEGYSGFVK